MNVPQDDSKTSQSNQTSDQRQHTNTSRNNDRPRRIGSPRLSHLTDASPADSSLGLPASRRLTMGLCSDLSVLRVPSSPMERCLGRCRPRSRAWRTPPAGCLLPLTQDLCCYSGMTGCRGTRVEIRGDWRKGWLYSGVCK